MSALLNFSVKQKDGSYKNYTVSIANETNKYGQNVTVYEEQTKEQREAKEPKKYLGNGKVFWTDGQISVASKVEAPKSEAPIKQWQDDELPF